MGPSGGTLEPQNWGETGLLWRCGGTTWYLPTFELDLQLEGYQGDLSAWWGGDGHLLLVFPPFFGEPSTSPVSAHPIGSRLRCWPRHVASWAPIGCLSVSEAGR